MSEEKKTNSIIETSPVINKILVVDQGRGGLKVGYGIAQTINGLMNHKKRTETVTRPVHKEIRDGFLDLRVHLLRSCGYYWPNEKIELMLLAKTVVTNITLGKKGDLQISGYLLMNGTHHAAISSPFLVEEDYAEFKELKSLVDTICSETTLFMSGVKSASVRTVVVDWMIKKKEVTNAEEAYNNMTQTEIDEITREALQESGLRVVMENGEMVIAPALEEHTNQISLLADEDEEEGGVEEITEEAPFEEVGEVGKSDDDLFIDVE